MSIGLAEPKGLAGEPPPGASAPPERVRVRLVYERLDGTQRCPPAQALSIALRERLGYDPVDFAAKELIRVTLASANTGGPRKSRKGRNTPVAAEIVATVVWLDAQGGSLGERILKGRGDRCAALLAQVALAVALALDPDAVQAVQSGHVDVRHPRRGQTATGAGRGARRGSEPTPPASPRPPSEPDRFALRMNLKLALFPTFGLDADAVGLGGAVEVGLGSGPWSGHLRLHLSGSWSRSAGQGDATARYRMLTPLLELGACFEGGPAQLCAVVAGGASVATGEGSAGTTTRTGATGWVGLRLALAVPLEGAVEPYLEVTATAPFARAIVVVADQEVFRGWPVVVALGLGMRVRLF